MNDNLYQQQLEFTFEAVGGGDRLPFRLRNDRKIHFHRTVFVRIMIAAVVAACGSPRPASLSPREATGVERSPGPGLGDSKGMLPEVNLLELGGAIVSAGSSTVFPLTERMAERFIDEGYAGQLTIDSIGSGAGFERLCVAGEIDISNASRPIKESELKSCQEIGREPIEFRVGSDALAVAMSRENDFVDNLTLESWLKCSRLRTPGPRLTRAGLDLHDCDRHTQHAASGPRVGLHRYDDAGRREGGRADRV